MNRTGQIIFTLFTLFALLSTSFADEIGTRAVSASERGDVTIDAGGTYCAGATVIDSSVTHYIDTGVLDQDDDCISPYYWPHNDVFYRFKPMTSRNYIFRFTLPGYHQKAAILLKRLACCSGGIVAAWDTNNVEATCDTGATAYLRTHLSSDSTYWIHLGNMAFGASHAPYRFEMMYVPCPTTESTLPHNTAGTAQQIALNDSIMGDSATFTHPKWFKFTLPTADSVIIQEFGRTFGHCNSGFYPACLTNPLDAHFIVYCDTFNHQLAEGHGGLCSGDAIVSLCLPAGTYYIQVTNYNGASWPGWTFLLSLTTRPAGNCAPLPVTCGEEQFLCPTGYDSIVTLTPDPLHIPGHQHVEACVRLDTTHVTTLVIPVLGPLELPTVSVANSCSTCTANGCLSLIGTWTYNPANWQYFAGPPRFVNTIRANQGATGCCVCVTLDFVLPVELQSFTAIAGDGEIALNWVTASETNNDHFELARNGAPITVVRGAGSSSARHTYHYTDQGLINGQNYVYTLVSVDANGGRTLAGTVAAAPQASASVVTEYNLRQNYPNPFNPSTSIGFDLVEAGSANLTVYNLMGQQVAVLVNGNLSAGKHQVNFDAANLPSGIYLYRLKVNGFVSEKKMLLMK